MKIDVDFDAFNQVLNRLGTGKTNWLMRPSEISDFEAIDIALAEGIVEVDLNAMLQLIVGMGFLKFSGLKSITRLSAKKRLLCDLVKIVLRP